MLIGRGLLTQDIKPNQIRFIEKVNQLQLIFVQADLNGQEMSNLFKFLKRGSPLFVPSMGRACRIKDHYSKFLTNRNGQVKHYYNPEVEMAVIEADIRTLIEEEFREEFYRQLLDPIDNFA